MSLKLWKKGESVTGTGRGKGAEKENLTGGSMIETEIETEIEKEIASAVGTDLAAGSENGEKTAPETGTVIGKRTGRETESDGTGVEAEREEMTEKTINMIHPEIAKPMTKSNGLMRSHMFHKCM